MTPEPQTMRPNTPLQAAMLRAAPPAADAANIEQVEVDFAAGVVMEDVGKAWAETVMKTEVLRHGFVFRDGEPCGLLPRDPGVAVSSGSEIPASWEKWLAEDRRRELPLDGGLPWRAVMWPEARKFVWTFHHALLDGRSIAVILRAFLTRVAGGSAPELEMTVPQLPDDAEIAAATEFHKQEIRRAEAVRPEFPGDGGGAPACISRCLGAETASRLEAAAAGMGVTAPTLLTWAWGQAVATAAGADAVAVGQVRSGPPQPGRAGFSMNTVPLVIDRAQPGPIEPVVRDFRRHLLKLREIEAVSPEDLTADVFHEAGGPWPGGVVMIQRGTLHHLAGAPDGVRSITLHETSGEHLRASAWIHPELRMEVEVNGNPFGERAAQSLLDQWVVIVTGIADEASGDAAELCGPPAGVREGLARMESGGAPAAHLHLAEAWSGSFADHASRCALWTPEGSWSYAELGAQVEHLAAGIQEAGVLPGERVACISRIRRNLPLMLLALARAGAIHVPLDPVLPDKRLQGIIDEAGPSLLLIDSREDESLFQVPCLMVDGAAGKTCVGPPPADPRATLSMLFTSGSTGMPKGVMMVHGGVTNEVLGIAGLAEIGPGDRVLQFASPGFDTSLEEMLAALLSGATLVPRPETVAADLDEFQSFIRDAGITVLDLPTAHWAAWCAWMVSENLRIPENVRSVIIGGERAAAATLGDWFAAGGREHLLVNTYGPTEASIVVTAECVRKDWNESGDPAIGRPLPGVEARVGDASGRVMPPGAAGELWLGGICIGDGYWRRPDLTDAAFREIGGRLWYRTGDRVYWDESGKLRFLGRRDEQLKIRGTRVEPNEVIRVLESHPGVSAAHVGPVTGGDGSLHLAGWIRWAAPPADGWPGTLAAHAGAHLAAAAIPTRWAAVEEFKLTERGKLDRGKLPDPRLTASTRVSSGPPATATEKRLAGMWSELLGIRTVGRDESFFELGGHSLAALRLFAAIHKQWKIRIPLAVLMQAPTPRLLGEVIDHGHATAAAGGAGHPFVVPVREEGHLPALFCIHGGDGGVLFYRNIVGHLPPGRPLLAIEAPALAGTGEVRAVPVEEAAADYLGVIRRCQPHGPYHLAGYSYGGLLVYEIARMLVADGEEVAFVGMFDTLNPAARIREYSLLERLDVFWESQTHPSWIGRIGRVLDRARQGVLTHFRVKNEIRLARNTGVSDPHSEVRMLQIREAHWQSMLTYQPGPLDCRVTLFKSKAPDDKYEIPGDYGWNEVVGSLEIIEVPGEHLTMFDPEHAANLANEISRRLGDGGPPERPAAHK